MQQSHLQGLRYRYQVPDETMEFVKYTVSKKKVLYLLEKLKSYSVVKHAFRKIEETIEDELNTVMSTKVS